MGCGHVCPWCVEQDSWQAAGLRRQGVLLLRTTTYILSPGTLRPHPLSRRSGTLDRVAFHDAGTTVTSLAAIKSFLAFGDAVKGLAFLHASQNARQLTELSKAGPCPAQARSSVPAEPCTSPEPALAWPRRMSGSCLQAAAAVAQPSGLSSSTAPALPCRGPA